MVCEASRSKALDQGGGRTVTGGGMAGGAAAGMAPLPFSMGAAVGTNPGGCVKPLPTPAPAPRPPLGPPGGWSNPGGRLEYPPATPAPAPDDLYLRAPSPYKLNTQKSRSIKLRRGFRDPTYPLNKPCHIRRLRAFKGFKGGGLNRGTWNGPPGRTWRLSRQRALAHPCPPHRTLLLPCHHRRPRSNPASAGSHPCPSDHCHLHRLYP